MSFKLSPEDRALLFQAYTEGVLNIVEPDDLAEGEPGRAKRLEEAGLLRSVAGASQGERRRRYYALSGAGFSELGPL